MTFQATKWLVLASIIAMPLYSLWEADRVKNAVLAGTKTRVRAYQEAMLFMWMPTLLLLALVAYGEVSNAALGLVWQGHLANWLGLAFVAAIAIYFFYSATSLSNNAELCEQYRNAAQSHDWMLPTNKSELRWFTAGLSISAGVCEELLFRGFLIGVMSHEVGVIASLVGSSLLFGICHLYQGWTNVLRTGVIGLVLGVIFILTESLWVVIVLHALVDVYGGFVGFTLNKDTKNPTKIRTKTELIHKT